MAAILVTGGCGFIGSHLVDDLLARGDSVRVLDLLHPLSHGGPPGYLNPAAEYVFGDVRDGELVARCLEGVDAVSHQAAMVGLGTDFGDVSEYVSHNDLGTATLLRELARLNRPIRLVLASSMVGTARAGGPGLPGARWRSRQESFPRYRMYTHLRFLTTLAGRGERTVPARPRAFPLSLPRSRLARCRRE
ncbi:MAG: NAD-dependent epimerase/dehydratase family protein [Gaiellaceae bacterium]